MGGLVLLHHLKEYVPFNYDQSEHVRPGKHS